jgi:hypothetical protein
VFARKHHGRRPVRQPRWRRPSRLSFRPRLETLEPRRLLAADCCDLLASAETMDGLQVVYHEDFETGDGGFMPDNSGGPLPGLWHYSIGRWNDNLPDHTPIHNWYYGAFETSTGGGHYVFPEGHQGMLMSPEISLPACGDATLTFSYLLDTRDELDRDFVDVFVSVNGVLTKVLSRQDGSLPETGNQWAKATADLSAFAGQTISLKFSFNTGDPPRVVRRRYLDQNRHYQGDCRLDPRLQVRRPGCRRRVRAE